ncbi:hypothetical protein WJX74_002245 [Apatococcus lobatus]|uniref:Hexosyltransferase n=1 Tax=Apatococcus lobatus TaxID=904363 RepID=A0AAW1R310_9CHLO
MLAISCQCTPVGFDNVNPVTEPPIKPQTLTRLRRLRQQHAKLVQSSWRKCALPPEQRPAITAFLGVFSEAQSVEGSKRRSNLRKSWFPGSELDMNRLQHVSGIVARMVLGQQELSAARLDALQLEEEQHGPIMRLPMQETRETGFLKVLAFWAAVTCQYDARFILKADDDVYLHVDKVPLLLSQWEALEVGYGGCFVSKAAKEEDWPHQLSYYKDDNSSYAARQFYGVPGPVVHELMLLSAPFRFFAREDVGVANWMKALDVEFLEDRRLCATSCLPTSVAIPLHPRLPGQRSVCPKSVPQTGPPCMLHLHHACSGQEGWQAEFEAHARFLRPFTDWAEAAQVELDRRSAASCSGAACFEGLIASG